MRPGKRLRVLRPKPATPLWSVEKRLGLTLVRRSLSFGAVARKPWHISGIPRTRSSRLTPR